jgi:tetratricopeptide (TPR) repeat protein
MTDLAEQKKKANDFRKAKNFEEALLLYRNLWKETTDKFDGAGLLHCLRKLGLFDEALILADELIVKYPDFKWCRNEVIWTYIQGILDKFNEEEPLEKVVEIAKRIMSLNPEDLAAKMVVFKVLKSAKSSNHWETVNEWVVKIDPDSLSAEPMMDDSGREGWSDQSLWYNYRINGLIEKGDTTEAISIVDEILERFPKQRKFLLRLKALANHILGNLSESEKIYQNLCSGYKPDWWMLHEYAKVVRDEDRKEDALKLMYQATSGHSKLESMVSLFVDIGMLCKELGKYEEARAHLVLCKYVRNEKGWAVPESIINTVDDLNKIIGNNKEPSSLKEALSICRNEWSKLLGKENNLKNLSYENRKVKKGLVGKVNLGRSDRPFCFIIAKDEQSFFCHKSDLPPDITDGNEVTFDAIPSFDKKKNKESWKASNIRHST